MSVSGENTPLDSALARLREGDPHGGLAILRESIERAKQQKGAGSAEYAAALFEQAQFCLAAGDEGGSIDALRRAAAVRVPGEEGTKDRLTYLRNLGEMLLRAGRRDEAEQVLREGLAERHAFYGPEHAGFAFGLEPVAEVVWKGGDPREALELAEQALGILGREGNLQFASVMALRACILHDAGAPGSAFEGLEDWPEDLREALIDRALSRAEDADPALAASVLGDLRTAMTEAIGPNHPELFRVLAAHGDAARKAGDHATRREALEASLALCESLDAGGQAVMVEQALALAHDDLGDPEAAERSYRGAAERAWRIGDHRLRANVLRNFGLFLNEKGRPDKAERTMEESLVAAEGSGDDEMIGRSLIALGIHRQHDGRLDDARALLTRGLDLLPPDHPDGLYGRSHLDAIESARSCGCGDMGGAIGDALRTMVLPHVPPGLLVDVRWEPERGLNVELSREPTEEEAAQLNTVIRQAMNQLQQKLGRAGYHPRG